MLQPLSFISLSLYCKDTLDIHEAAKLLPNISQLFQQIVLLDNRPLTNKEPVKNILSCAHPFFSIIDMHGHLEQGSALNKLLAHVWTPWTLVLDAAFDIQSEHIQQLTKLVTPKTQSPLFLGFQYARPLHKLHPNPNLSTQSKEEIQFSSTLPWGGLAFRHQDLLSIGGFHPKLSYEALMVELCFRIQYSEGMLAILPYQLTQRKYFTVPDPSPKELLLLREKHPDHYRPWWKKLLEVCIKESVQKNKKVDLFIH